MIVVQCEQLSDSWWEARRGVPTASEFSRILSPAKGIATLATQNRYICELIADICCQNPKYFSSQGRPTKPMQDGRDSEGAARAWYEMETGEHVDQVGFCLTDDRRFGCSPDGLLRLEIGDRVDDWRGLPAYQATAMAHLELKCPLLKTQLEWLMKGELPRQHKCQLHGEGIVCGTAWGHFLSYSEGGPPLMLKVSQDEFTAKLKAELDAFWLRYTEALDNIRKGTI